ncbi:MAG TPA: ABC transporter ATP-binding protein/permease [Candidatus Limadaptatus stercorigallinarum]|uniref:ABC transporter ATP-binding protein/permease n=1 Tax=Candidatus Limadaptatus stercorigallinarum TaxID=2840845 RepID=A0A9D1HTT1_9FIRM|nr:ABC transporter ATP-binding protein/permease [Candidatus Limadaptatus stercorigallinarum]
MLELRDIVKDYVSKENVVHVLKGVNLRFRKSEFVAILGPSGCGKTTLLNIIGGLDRYTSGDILVDGVSTKDYSDHDWDIYRNHRIGFVFQSYNLIPHLTVQRNVEMSMAIAGLPPEERKAKALAALERVGLADQAKKKPAQLSGGQMQRVAIARSIVNDPDIILADEPTGALDSESGEQVMELLQEVAKEKLVVMVTHNNALAEKYSKRIIDLRDGVVTSDSAPYAPDEESAEESAPQQAAAEETTSAEEVPAEEMTENEVYAPEKAVSTSKTRKRRAKKRGDKAAGSYAAMSLGTAASLSFTNLISKKGRTILTALAGSIGIIGIILVLALSGGAQAYIASMEEDVLSQYPIEINRTNSDLNSVISILMQDNEDREDWPYTDEVYINQIIGRLLEHLSAVLDDTNDLAALKTYIEENFDSDMGYVKYDYGVDFDVFCNYINDPETYLKVDPFTEGIEAALGGLSGLLGPYMDMIEQFGDMLTVWDEMLENTSLLDSQYELVGENSRWPQNYDEVVIVLDEENSLNDYTLFALGLKDTSELVDAIMNGDDFVSQDYSADDLIGIEYRVTTSSDYYYQNADGSWSMVSDRTEQRQIEFVESHSVPVTVVGVIRPREGTQVTSINGNIAYTHALTEYLSDRAAQSDVAEALTATAHQSGNDTMYYNILEDGAEIDAETYMSLMRELGIADTDNPVTINIYANSLSDKAAIEQFIADYNAESGSTVKYTDDLGTMMTYVDSLTGTVTGVLVGFAAISLIVSSIMIAIIIYTSVLERRKEIGVLRSLGARKKDISRVFISESALIGLVAGILGVIIAAILFMPINLVMQHYLHVGNLLQIEWWHAVMMIGISVVLAILAGFIPSRIASKKDPVTCLHED